MNYDFLLIAILGILIIPIIIELIVRPLYYRLNDLTTNLSLGMINTVAGIIIGAPTLLVYLYYYNNFAIFQLSSKDPITWILAFFFLDFLSYWVHRAYHNIAIFWTLHAVHHSGEDMNYSLAVRESVFGNFIVWAFFLPVAILGVPLEVYFPLFVAQVIYQYFQHNSYIPELGWLEYIFVTPSQHRVHHGKNMPYIDKNFGIILVIWDRMFGTYQKELPECPVVYGLSNSAKSWNPLTVNLHHIRKLIIKVRGYHGIGDKLRALAYTPGWVPTDQNTVSQSKSRGIVSEKYDSSIPQSALRYGVSHFLVAFSMFLLFLVTNDGPMLFSTPVVIGFILFTTIVVGGIFDAKDWVLPAELTRISLLVGLTFLLLASGKLQFDLSSQLLILYSLVSVVYLLHSHRALRTISQ